MEKNDKKREKLLEAEQGCGAHKFCHVRMTPLLEGDEQRLAQVDELEEAVAAATGPHAPVVDGRHHHRMVELTLLHAADIAR